MKRLDMQKTLWNVVGIVLRAGMGAMILSSLGGCAYSQAEEGDLETEESETGEARSAFGLMDLSSQGSLVHRVKAASGGVRVCLTGPMVTAANRPTIETEIRKALIVWVDGIRPMSTVPLITSSDVTFSCASPHLNVEWLDTPGYATTWYDSTTTTVQLHVDSTTVVILHELGHGFGLVDTYLSYSGGPCKPGHATTALMCNAELGYLAEDDVVGVQEAFCVANPGECRGRWETSTGFCTGATEKLYVGKLNGDARSDLLCHDRITGMVRVSLADATGRFAGTSWESSLGWCNGAGDQLHIGDFDGNQRSDMLCRVGATGGKRILYSSFWGTFTGTPWETTTSWCNGANEQIYIGDFNGDGRSDVLCHDPTTGSKQVGLASPSGTVTTWEWMGTTGCVGSEQLLIGDFNGDRRSDMLCHDAATGAKRVFVTTPAGYFYYGASWQATLDYCKQAGARLFAGDFNADGLSDLACVDYTYVYVALHQGAPSYFTGPSRYWGGLWAISPQWPISVGDFDNNGSADLLCHKQASGLKVHFEKSANLTVDVGYNHSCSLKRDGTARCWGSSDNYGDKAPLGVSFASLSLGINYSCGLTAGGAVQCWGANVYENAASVPAGVFAQISAGHTHTCARKADGSVQCWGDNTNGQAGSKTGPYTAISAGGAHTCALKPNGNVECWGANFNGQAPATKTGPFSAIASGGQHTCALRPNGSAICWGNNASGQAPAFVAGPFVAITSGQEHSCGLKLDGSVVCWGKNNLGQTTAPGYPFKMINAHGHLTCGLLKSDDSLSCWGDNSSGQSNSPL